MKRLKRSKFKERFSTDSEPDIPCTQFKVLGSVHENFGVCGTGPLYFGLAQVYSVIQERMKFDPLLV